MNSIGDVDKNKVKKSQSDKKRYLNLSPEEKQARVQRTKELRRTKRELMAISKYSTEGKEDEYDEIYDNYLTSRAKANRKYNAKRVRTPETKIEKSKKDKIRYENMSPEEKEKKVLQRKENRQRIRAGCESKKEIKERIKRDKAIEQLRVEEKELIRLHNEAKDAIERNYSDGDSQPAKKHRIPLPAKQPAEYFSPEKIAERELQKQRRSEMLAELRKETERHELAYDLIKRQLRKLRVLI
jgi:hypothetical protein